MARFIFDADKMEDMVITHSKNFMNLENYIMQLYLMNGLKMEK